MPLPPINPIPVGEGKIRYQKEEQLKNKKKETKTAPSEENALEQSEGGT